MAGPGKPGPTPKRTDEIMGHRTKAELAARGVEQAPGAAHVDVPPPDATWHEIAINWYVSLTESGQSRYFEPSDWAVAQYVAEAMTRNIQSERFSAQLMAAVLAAANDLLSTEGARRRLRLELQRPQEEQQSAQVTGLEEYKQRLLG